MGDQELGVVDEQLHQPVLPTGVDVICAEVEVAQQLVQDGGVQLCRVVHVYVQRGRSGVQLGGEATHSRPLETFLIEDAYGDLDNALSGQGRLRRPVAAADWLTSWFHNKIVANMFVTDKYGCLWFHVVRVSACEGSLDIARRTGYST